VLGRLEGLKTTEDPETELAKIDATRMALAKADLTPLQKIELGTRLNKAAHELQLSYVSRTNPGLPARLAAVRRSETSSLAVR
jgi:hypothetical protein